MSSILTPEEVRRALSIRDLTRPDHGPHAMQLLVDAAASALSTTWNVAARVQRSSPIVSVSDNYDRLGYSPEAAARDARYTRYVCDVALLRTQTSALVPPVLRELSATDLDDILLVCPGLTYRRDCIDRLHTGEPHQLDLWRIRRGKLDDDDLREMIALLMKALLPGRAWQTSRASHPYTTGGLQIDVRDGRVCGRSPSGRLADAEAWVEIGECGLVHPELLVRTGHDPARISGLALGLGLDRLLMLRKGINDIRLLRSSDERVARQMLDLEPYRPVSTMPAVRRDLSLAVAADARGEDIGDRVRAALGVEAEVIESMAILSETPYERLPAAAIERMGVSPLQKNVLLRIVLRALDRSLTHGECNILRDRIYAAVHQGERKEWSV
jgi:phenylalanyl-tRNA synthetase alpha chain